MSILINVLTVASNWVWMNLMMDLMMGMDQLNYGGLGWENKEYLDISTFVLHILYFCCIYGMTVN